MLAKGRRRGFEPGDDISRELLALRTAFTFLMMISAEQLIAQTIYQAALQERSLHDQDVAISYVRSPSPSSELQA